MTDIFNDQSQFMQACGQTVDHYNGPQYHMYCSLIEEEFEELKQGLENNDRVEQLDALIDILVVTVGAIHSLGADGLGAWNEVMRSNLSKVDAATGKVKKREDGKILKPPGYSPPNLKPFVNA